MRRARRSRENVRNKPAQYGSAKQNRLYQLFLLLLLQTCLPPSEQAVVDRFLMVSEPLVHLLLPPREERRSLKIDVHPIFCEKAAKAPRSSSGAKKRHHFRVSGGGVEVAEERRGWREFIGNGRDDEFAREVSNSPSFSLSSFPWNDLLRPGTRNVCPFHVFHLH